MNNVGLPCRELVEILQPAYGPCPAFETVCREMQWVPEKGHVPRGFCGALGRLKDVKLVLIMAEPGDPHIGESHLGNPDPDELIAATSHYSYQCYHSEKDLFHQNVQYILDLYWPGLGFEEKMRRTWITESVLCSAKKEGGNVPARVCRECTHRYLKEQLDLLSDVTVVALGSKARDRTKGIPGIAAYGAAAPPGCNRRGVRRSWAEIPKLVRARENIGSTRDYEELSQDKMERRSVRAMKSTYKRSSSKKSERIQKGGAMVWTHQRLYDALVKKGHYEKSRDRDKYVSLDHHGLRNLNMVLYRPDTQSYGRSPLHIKKSKAGFSEDLFKRISPAIELVSPGGHGWKRYRIIDWGKLAKDISLIENP